MRTGNMDQIKIANILARATRKGRFLTEAERRSEGAETFKRKVLGLCGSQSVKTLDEMAQTLYATGVASSIEEGREIVPTLIGTVRYNKWKGLSFDEVTDGEGSKRYRVSDFVARYDSDLSSEC